MLTLRARWRPSRHALQYFAVGHHRRGLAQRTNGGHVESSVIKTAHDKVRRALCHTRHAILDYLDFWILLRRLGVSNNLIVGFRRRMRRFHYPWLTYSVPTAVALMTGDVIAQQFIDERKKEMNWCRTVHYGLIGFFLVGPIASKLFLMWNRRMGRGGRLVRMSKSVLYDIFIVTPVLVATIIAAYDYKFLYETVKDIVDKMKKDKLDQKSLKSEMNKLVERYKHPFTEDMILYLQTKPLIALTACFLLPSVFRGYLRRLYYMMFYSYVSNRNFKYKMGPEIEKYRAGKKSDGVGGPACMLRDAIVAKLNDTFKKSEREQEINRPKNK